MNAFIVQVERSHPLINNYNAYIIAACRCNMDIKFIWTGSDAKALVYYVSNADYISLRMHSFIEDHRLHHEIFFVSVRYGFFSEERTRVRQPVYYR